MSEFQTYGKVLSIDTTLAGSTVIDGSTGGDTNLVVNDASAFDAEGGQITILDTVYTYTAVDFDADSLTVPAGVPDLEDGERVTLYPDSPERVAEIDLGEDQDSIPVVVPHNLAILLDDGVRDPDDQETVLIEQRGDYSWVIVDLVGRPAIIPASAIDIDLSDGDAPETSPAPTVTGSVGFINVRWTAITNNDPVTYQVHISTTAGFTPDPTTLALRTPATSATIRTLPDGTPIVVEMTYYIQIIAEDVDGAAAPSTEASGMSRLITSEDVSVEFLYAGSILADQITGGTVQSDLLLSGTIRTATAGSRVELSSGGVVVYDSTGTPTTVLGSDGNSTFRGDVQANTLTVVGGCSIRGAANEISKGGSLALASGTTAPSNPPTVVTDFETFQLRNADGTPVTTAPTGLSFVSGNSWVTSLSNNYCQRFSSTTGVYIESIGHQFIKTNFVLPTYAGPGYYFDAQGYLWRDRDYATTAGDRYQLYEDWASPFGTWTRTGVTTAGSGNTSVTSTPGGVSSLSKTGYAFEGHYFRADLSTTSKQQFGVLNGMRVKVDDNNYAFLGFAVRSTDGATMVSWRVVTGGVASPNAYVEYDPATMVSFEIFERSGEFRFLTYPSASSTSYTLLGAISHTFTKTQLNSMAAELWANDSNPDGMLVNPDFTTPAHDDHWFGTRCNTSWTLSPARSGGGALVMTSNGSGTNMIASNGDGSGAVTNIPRASPGQTYTATAWTRANTVARSAFVRITFLDSSGASAGGAVSGSAATNSTSAWTQHTATATAPANAYVVRVDVYVTNNGTTSEIHYVDDVRIDYTPIVVTNDNLKVGWKSTFGNYARVNTTQVPALGWDSAAQALLVAEVRSSDSKIVISTVDPKDMTTISTTMVTSSTFTGPLVSVMKGSFDFGSARYIVKQSGNVNDFWVFTTAGVHNINEDFPSDAGNTVGAVWDGATFVSVSTKALLYRRSGIIWNDAGATTTFAAGFTWYDGDSTGGTHETALSPVAAFSMPKRGRFTVTSPEIPDNGGSDDPDRIRVYAAKSGATRFLQSTTAAGVNTLLVSSIVTSGTTAPSSSNFPDATPATITSGDGTTMVISGNGTIKGIISASPQLISTAVDLNTYTTPGQWYLTTSANATIANNYPAALAGLLEVMGSTGTYIWQRYTTYRNAGTMEFTRQFFGGTWGDWIQTSGKDAQSVNKTTSNSNGIGSYQDVGLTMTVTTRTPGDKIMVSCVLDAGAITASATGNYTGRLQVDGSSQPQLIVWVAAGNNGLRATVGQQWLLSGLSVGDHVLNIQSQSSADYTTRPSHSTLVAFVL